MHKSLVKCNMGIVRTCSLVPASCGVICILVTQVVEGATLMRWQLTLYAGSSCNLTLVPTASILLEII